MTLPLDPRSPFPILRLSDGGKDGRGCDYQVTCWECRWFNRCRHLQCTTDKSTTCAFVPSRFRDLKVKTKERKAETKTKDCEPKFNRKPRTA